MTPYRAELHRLGEATRSVIEHLVAIRAPVEDLARAADLLEDVAAKLADYPQGRLYEGFAESANAGAAAGLFDHSPMLGLANPLAPPIRVDLVDDVVVGKVHFGSAYEGPPGCVHGGFLAAAFDEVLGMTQSMSGRPGMTGTLSIRYRRPTPLHHDLVF
ncbi:MAG: PaaI family thioesterase, partial [Acidimicrobiales bacterium]